MENCSFLKNEENFEALNGDISKLIECTSDLNNSEKQIECNDDVGESEFTENDLNLISYYSKLNEQFQVAQDITDISQNKNINNKIIENVNTDCAILINNEEYTRQDNDIELFPDANDNEFSLTLYNTLIKNGLIDNTELPKIRVRTDLFRPEFRPKPPITGLSFTSENLEYEKLKIVGKKHFRRYLGRLEWSKVLCEDDYLQMYKNLLQEIDELEDLDEIKEHIEITLTFALKKLRKMIKCKIKSEKLEQQELHAVQNVNLRKHFKKSLKFWKHNREKIRKTIKTKKWCLCRREAKFYCCWQEFYCSLDCQKSAWSSHVWKCKQLAMKMDDPHLRVNNIIKGVLMNGFTPRDKNLISLLRELLPREEKKKDLLISDVLSLNSTEECKVISTSKSGSTVNLGRRNYGDNKIKKRSVGNQSKINKKFNNYLQKKRERLSMKSAVNFNENNYSETSISGRYSKQYLNAKYKKKSDECDEQNFVNRKSQSKSISFSTNSSGISDAHNEIHKIQLTKRYCHQPASTMNNKRYEHFLQIPIYKIKGKSDQLFLPELAKQIQPHISKALFSRLNTPVATIKSNQHLNKATLKLTLKNDNSKDVNVQKNTMTDIVPLTSNVSCKKIIQIQQPSVTNNYAETSQPVYLKTPLVTANQNKKHLPMLITKSVSTKLSPSDQSALKLGLLPNKIQQSSNLHKRRQQIDKSKQMSKKQISCTPYYRSFDLKNNDTLTVPTKKFKGSGSLNTMSNNSFVEKINSKTEKYGKPVKKLLLPKNFKIENKVPDPRIFNESDKYYRTIVKEENLIEDGDKHGSPIDENPGSSNSAVLVRNLKLDNINKPITIYQKQRRVSTFTDNDKRQKSQISMSEKVKEQTKFSNKIANTNAKIVKENSQQSAINNKKKSLNFSDQMGSIKKKTTHESIEPHIFVGKDNKYKIALPTNVPQNRASKPVYIITDLPINCNKSESNK